MERKKDHCGRDSWVALETLFQEFAFISLGTDLIKKLFKKKVCEFEGLYREIFKEMYMFFRAFEC